MKPRADMLGPLAIIAVAALLTTGWLPRLRTYLWAAANLNDFTTSTPPAPLQPAGSQNSQYQPPSYAANPGGVLSPGMPQ